MTSFPCPFLTLDLHSGAFLPKNLPSSSCYPGSCLFAGPTQENQPKKTVFFRAMRSFARKSRCLAHLSFPLVALGKPVGSILQTQLAEFSLVAQPSSLFGEVSSQSKGQAGNSPGVPGKDPPETSRRGCPSPVRSQNKVQVLIPLCHLPPTVRCGSCVAGDPSQAGVSCSLAK